LIICSLNLAEFNHFAIASVGYFIEIWPSKRSLLE